MTRSAKLLATLLLFAALVMVNYLASHLPWRADLTANRVYTLSDGTRSLLAQVEEPIVLDFYFSSSITGLPIGIKNQAARTEEMLRQYVRAADGKLVLNVINPEPDTPEEEAAARAGITPRMMPATGESVYFGLSATAADQQGVIGVFLPNREAFLEYDLSSLIHSVQLLEKPRIGLLSSLPLQAPPPNPMMMQMGQRPPEDQFILGEWSQLFEVVTIAPDALGLPANLDVLVVVHPQGLSADLEYAIDQFLLGGSPVLLALDPSSEHFKRQVQQQQMMMGSPPNVVSDLPHLLSAYGISYDTGDVMGDRLLGAQVSTGRAIVRMPHWLQLTSESFNTELMPTAQLASMVLVEAGRLALTEGSALEFTPLLQTSAQAGSVPPMLLQMAAMRDISGEIQPDGPHTLGALFTGTFPTAFPEGQPAAMDTEEADAAAEAGLKSGEGTLVIIADTDWLLDDYSVRRLNFGGFQAAEPLNDNLAFATNLVEFLAGSSELISIRSKGSSDRPFTVVREMEAAAQQRYQEQLDALEQRLSEVQQELGSLQAQVGEGGLLVASPEIEAAIAEFQAQEAEMRRERRDIRRALREDIDALETRLLLINLLAVPLALGVFAWVFQRSRRRHAAA